MMASGSREFANWNKPSWEMVMEIFKEENTVRIEGITGKYGIYKN